MLDSNIRQYLEKLLIDIDNSATLGALDNATSEDELTTAWTPIVKNLSTNYTIRHDNYAKYHEMLQNNTIDILEPVVEYCLAQLDGKLSQNRELANDLIQLHFIIANFYSLNGQYEKAFAWYKKNFEYITKENLEKTLNGILFHNLLGNDIANLSQAELVEDYPAAARKHFEIALQIHKDLGNTLDNSPDMRYTQINLINAIIEESIDKIIKNKIQMANLEENKEILKELLKSAIELILELKDNIPKDDLHQQALTLQSKANLQALDIDVKDAFSESLRAIKLIIRTTPRNHDQLSRLGIELSRIRVMLATELYLEVITEMSEKCIIGLYGTHGFEESKPFINAAKRELLDILNHPFAKLYLTIAGITELSPDNKPSAKDCYIDGELLDASLPERLEISLYRSINSIYDFKKYLKSAHTLLIAAAANYAHVATNGDANPIYAKVAKRELSYLLNNPYVASLKNKISDLSAIERDDLFEKSQPEGMLNLLFSEQPKVNFSKIVDLNKAKTNIEKKSHIRTSLKLT